MSMNNTKEKKARLQIIISVMVLTVILFAEMYLMINFRQGYLAIILLAVVALVAVYIMANAIMTLAAEKEAKREEHFENLYRSEKASYIMLKKSFDEIEEKLNIIQEVSKVPAEEIINAQKGIAKVIINRTKENADAIINSNDQVLERLDEVEETHSSKLSSLSKEQHLELSDFGSQADLKIQDLMLQLKDTELRLNQAIMNGTKVVMPTPVMQSYAAPVETSIEDLMASADDILGDDSFDLDALFPEETTVEEPVFEEIPMMEEPAIFEEEPVFDETSVFDETPVFEEEPVIEEEPIVIEEPVEEEKPPMPDLSDPNKALSADEIAALFANMAPAEEPVAEPIIEEEPIIIEEPVEEEKPPMPDLSDPNKVMSPDEIAALIANL